MFQTEPAGRGARTVEKVVNQKVRVSKYKTWAFKKLVLSSWSLSRISSQISGVERKVPSKRSPAVSDKNARVTCCLVHIRRFYVIFYLLPKQGRERDFFLPLIGGQASFNRKHRIAYSISSTHRVQIHVRSGEPANELGPV